MGLTKRQKYAFYTDGFLKITDVVPPVMVQNARHVINYSLGEEGMDKDELPTLRARSYCPEAQKQGEITGLFNNTPAFSLIESLLGSGNLKATEAGQIALRFPRLLGQDAPSPRGHLDGLGSGLNGSAKGTYRRGFTGLAVIYLADVPAPNGGNFTVWPGSHRFFENYFIEHGHQVLEQGMPKVDLPMEPLQLTGQAGDLILAHHQLVHTAAPNVSADVRYAAIFRIHHVDCQRNGLAAYTNIWHEWPGIRSILGEEELTI